MRVAGLSPLSFRSSSIVDRATVPRLVSLVQRKGKAKETSVKPKTVHEDVSPVLARTRRDRFNQKAVAQRLRSTLSQDELLTGLSQVRAAKLLTAEFTTSRNFNRQPTVFYMEVGQTRRSSEAIPTSFQAQIHEDSIQYIVVQVVLVGQTVDRLQDGPVDHRVVLLERVEYADHRRAVQNVQ